MLDLNHHTRSMESTTSNMVADVDDTMLQARIPTWAHQRLRVGAALAGLRVNQYLLSIIEAHVPEVTPR